MVARPAFQHQGPSGNCKIDHVALGWLSCTAYAMAMLIDAATDGAKRPKGCAVRQLVAPQDLAGGLDLGQVSRVADKHYKVPISIRTGTNAVTVKKATEQIRAGRGFLLQGNNIAFKNKGDANHAIYVHAVRGGTPEMPAEALTYDPQRAGERWIPWKKILAFGAELRLNKAGTRKLGPGLLYAGFPPKPVTPAEAATLPSPVVIDDVDVRFDAVKLPDDVAFVAAPPPGRRVNIRRSPRNLASEVADTLGKGEQFTAYQRVDDGSVPPGAGSAKWFGNRDGTEWVHASGLRRAADA